MKIILALLLVSVVFAGGCVGNTDNSRINYKGLDGDLKTIDIKGKTFQQICGETFGTWMSAEDGMRETRNGYATGRGPCSGCMTDSSNMFCNQGDYINAIKVG